MGLLRIAKKGADELVELADSLLNTKEVVPKKSKKKVADMTPEEREAHNAYQRQKHKERQDKRNPNRRVKQDVQNMTPEQKEVWNQERLAKKREQEARRVAGLTDEQVAAKKARERNWRQENKEALRQRKQEYRDANREEVRKRQREAYHADPQRLEKAAANRERNRESIREQQRQYYAENPAPYIENARAREMALRERMPSWRDQEKINEIYNAKSLIEQITGIPHHVDHMIPLQGKNVSGLHHQDNLMIVPGAENLSKGNRFTPGTPPPKTGGVRQARRLLKQLEKANKGQ